MLRIWWLPFVLVCLTTFGTSFPNENNEITEISVLNSESIPTVTENSDGIKNNVTVTGTEPAQKIGTLKDGNKTSGILSSSSSSVSETPKSSSTVQTSVSTSSANPKSSTTRNNILSATSNETETISESSIFNNETDSFNGTHDDEGVRSYFLSKAMFWNDDFLSGIIAPVLVGLAAALLIITIIMCFKCFRTSLTNRKRVSNSRILRGDIRKMKHIDRVKLLAASSDDEF